MTPSVETTFSAAQTAFEAGDLPGAARMLAALLQADPDDVDALCLLAGVQDQQKDVYACAATLERLMVLAPSRIDVWKYRLLAKQKLHAGETERARAILAQALVIYPSSLDLRIMYANNAGSLEEVCAALEGIFAKFSSDPVAASMILNTITVRRANLARAAKALPDDAISWEDGSVWPDPEGLERFRRVINAQMKQSQRGELVLDAACVAIWNRKWDRADELFRLVRKHRAGTYADYAAFGSKFHGELDHYDYETISRLLPPVHHILTRPRQAKETLLLASDPNYFRQFTLPFLATLERMALPLDIQVHVMGGDEASWQGMALSLDQFSHVRAAFSAEDPGQLAVGISNVRVYSHAIRFVRLFQEAARTRRPVWVFDVDAFVQKDPRPLFARLDDCDVSIRVNPCLLTPPARVAGNLVGIAPTERGLEYARRVAAYILHFKERGTWAFGIDQVALDSAYVHMDRMGSAPKTYFQGHADASNRDDGESVFYFPTGANKYFAAEKPAA